MEKTLEKNDVSLKRYQRISSIFLLIFFSEIILGCNGHWVSLNVSGFALTPRMIMFVILCLGYAYYLFRFKKWSELLQPLPIVVLILFCFLFFVFGIGIYRYSFENAWPAFSEKFYLIGLIPLASAKTNPYFTKKKIISVLFGCSLLVSIGIFILFFYSKALNWTPFQTRTFIWSYTNRDFKMWGVYDNGGIFFTSVLFCLLSSAIAFPLSFFSSAKISHRIFYAFLGLVFSATVIESSSRGMEIALLLSFLIAIICYFRKTTQRIKAEKNREKQLSLKIWILFAMDALLFSFGIGALFLAKRGFLSRFSNMFADETVSYRISFLQKGINLIFSFPFFVGKGFGAGSLLIDNGVHLEIDFLEVFLDEGFIGFSLWIGIFVLLFYSFGEYKKKNYAIGLGTTLSFFSLLLVSFTNPYTTNFFGIVTMGIFYCICKSDEESYSIK